MSKADKGLYTEVRKMVDQLIQADGDIGEWLAKSKVIEAVERLPGDASARRYYRIRSGGLNFIVMKTEPFSEEGPRYPFLIVQKHLAEAEVDVPQMMDFDAAKGFVLLEDLGDVTLLRHLQEVSSPDIERHLYQRVIDSLVHMQFNASPNRKPAELEAYRLRFDHEKLMWEVNFTFEHFYDTYLKREINARDRAVMLEGFSEICALLSNEPTVLTHRDFHSRNVMVTPFTEDHASALRRSSVFDSAKGRNRLVMIDFQDARMGPPQYDLASLLRDSYYQLEEAQVARLLDYYIARWEAISGQDVNRQNFFMLFDLMSVQRNFKAIGSFASFLNRRNNATYLKYIGNTFENIRRTLIKYPQYSALRELLFHYYYF